MYDPISMDALVVAENITDTADRITIKAVVFRYEDVLRENIKFNAMFQAIARELECIPEMEYIISTIQDLKGLPKCTSNLKGLLR